ncbi:MAG: molybdate ABC transporter substrate-binding protein [Hyphomicrobiales bacterium]|nr:molybdate ABC transporter substrate-binding protein [Hyphomicrobiales bacterium]
MAVCAWGVMVGANKADAGEVRVAVATNFTQPAKEIGGAFEMTTGHNVIFSFGSTGQLYAQITQDAPFDVFLAADQERPNRAVDEGFAIKSSLFTYAKGRIALFSRASDLIGGEAMLSDTRFSKLAIANPLTAPYGAAAVEVLNGLGVYDALAPRIVKGNNIAQTYQFVETGNAEIGFVALSQIALHAEGSRWIVPEEMHAAIAQDAVHLIRGRENEAAAAFMKFLRDDAAQAIKEKYGYGAGSGPSS